MTEQQSSYRQIMKATSIFGGVQVFQIIIQVIRSKFVAILLGPSGMGIAGLLTSTIQFITGLSNFGLGTSAVKDIASASATGNQTRIAIKVIVLRRLVWITGMLGAVITLILSSWLSQLIFGNHDYTVAFIWISITLLFTQLTSGQIALLQGMRKLQHLAKANLFGSASGLVITVPLYYYLGIKGIVPAIIIGSLVTLLLSWYFSSRVKIEPVRVTMIRTFAEGKSMLKLGFIISLSGIMATGAAYVIRIFISKTGGLAQTGLYNGGFAIINTYVGLIFTAMGTDYYPRLSALADDNRLCKETINQQAEIAVLILAPILLVFQVFINWVIIILYSTKFIAINQMLYWAALGVFFKAASWSVSFIFLAKGASKFFFWNELISNIYMLGLNIIGYKLLGLMGLGMSFMAGYMLYMVQVFFLSKYKYEFSFSNEFKWIFSIQISLALGSFLAMKFIPTPFNYFAGLGLIILSSWYSLRELDKRIGLAAIAAEIKSRFIKK